MKYLALVLALALAGCGGNSVLPSPAATIYASKNTFAGLQTVAIQYTSLPRCGQPKSPVICSDPGFVGEIRTANNDAATALAAAETTVRDPSSSTSTINLAVNAAVNAVGALQTILNQTKAK